MKMNCPICNYESNKSLIKVRSNKLMELNSCDNCSFSFFFKDPTLELANNQLDESRLKSAGLDIPSIEKDFENGTNQSIEYVNEYFENEDLGKNILEIGCSWGYFLKLLKDRGCNTYGLELNLNRSAYVRDYLDIPCFDTFEECEESGKKFDKIYLFYVLEYIPSPIEYFSRLLNMLEVGGKIILITPNFHDFLKDGLRNEAFNNFFYDEHAINYFTYLSSETFLNQLPLSKYNLFTKQGYSFINHLSWHLTNAPRTTGIVGGDRFVTDLSDKLNSELPFKENITDLIMKFDLEYKKILSENNFGNQIHMILFK